MTTLMQASRQWASRPADERFVSLHEMGAKMRDLRNRSRQTVESTRKIELFPDEADPKHRGLYLGMDAGPLAGAAMAPTHWSFGQLCSLASPGISPASYFRDSGLPAPMIADNLNFNLRFSRKVDEVGCWRSSAKTPRSAPLAGRCARRPAPITAGSGMRMSSIC
jgi:hypothetical protein